MDCALETVERCKESTRCRACSELRERRQGWAEGAVDEDDEVVNGSCVLLYNIEH